jgi:hypothetical protein
MITPSLRRGRGLASYYVTASLLWLAGIIVAGAEVRPRPSPYTTIWAAMKL